MATILDITNIKTSEKAAMDSHSFLSILTGKSEGEPLRTSTIHNTNRKGFAVRNGKWLYINQSTGDVSRMPDYYKKLRGYKDFTTKGLLFDLDKDLEQRTNLYNEYPKVISEMELMLKKELDRGYLK